MSYNFGVLAIELWLNTYVESWGQTLGMLLFGLCVLTCRPLGPTSRRGRKIKIHNSIIWIWGRKHAILREKLHRVLGSRSWNHGLNGELFPEHFQKCPRNFGFFPQHLVEGLLNFRRRVCRSFWLDLAFQDPPGNTDQ